MKLNLICKKDECTGCYACYNVCPVHAITFVEDKFGNVYPKIDLNRCIKCNKCRRTCPSINKNTEFRFPDKCYAAYSKCREVNNNSSSGGMAYELGKKIIENGGVYYGVSSYCSNQEIIFERIDTIEKLPRVQGSKYVHAHVNDTYKEIEKDLNINKNVIFIATPCQVSGLKSFLNKDYDNLYTVDLVCHGVPSQKFLKEEIGKEFDYVSFRKGRQFDLVAKKEEKEVYHKNKYNSNYYYYYLKGSIYRENCYNCKYAKNERVADITIGDFWGLNNKRMKSKYGTSIVMINTGKGKALFETIDSIEKNEEKIDDGFKYNPQLNHTTNHDINVDEFAKLYKGDFKKTCKKMYKMKDNIIIIKGTCKEKIKKMIRGKKNGAGFCNNYDI